MQDARYQPRFRFIILATIASALTLVLTCGKKAPPLPPLIIAPEPPSNAKVRQAGDVFIYFFQIPSISSDYKTPAEIGKMEIYRLKDPRIQMTQTQTAATQTAPASQTQTAPQTQTTPAQTQPAVSAQTQTAPQTQTQTQTQAQTQQTQTQSQPQSQTQPGLPKPEEDARSMEDKEFEDRADKIVEIAEDSVPAYVRDNYIMLVDKINTAADSEDFRNWFYYAVKIYNKKGKATGFSKLVALYPEVVPKAPSQFTGKLAEKQIELTWASVVEDIEGKNIPEGSVTYNIYRGNSANFAPDEPINPEPLTTTTYIDTTFQFGQSHYYFVRAHLTSHKKAHTSAPSNIMLIYPQDTFPPKAPEELNAVSAREGMVLIWAPNPEDDVVGYNIYRSFQPGEGHTKINRELVRETTHTDPDVQPGKTYYYVVTAVDSAPVPNESPRSVEASETARTP